MPLWTILTKWPAPAGPAMDVALLGRRLARAAWGEGREDRFEPVERRLVAADHLAIAALDAPDAAGGADIHVGQPLRLQGGGPADVVLEHRVAAVDDRVAGLEQAGEFVDAILGDLARPAA